MYHQDSQWTRVRDPQRKENKVRKKWIRSKMSGELKKKGTRVNPKVSDNLIIVGLNYTTNEEKLVITSSFCSGRWIEKQ